MKDVKVAQHGSLGLIWIVGWLFSIGFLKLGFWAGFIALFFWPYSLGVFFSASY